MLRAARTVFVAIFAAVVFAGCAGPVEQWILDTRVHQGDTALAKGNYTEAQLAYSLALKVDPTNERARAGFSTVAAQIAESEYRAGHLDDALQTLTIAAKYDPQSVRMQALRSQVEQAKIKREIVVSNYPTYSETASQIRKSYALLSLQNKNIIDGLKKFDYNYNINELNKAIQNSYELNLEVARNTNKLIAFRQLVESGTPAEKATIDPGLAAPASLLPLP